MHAEAVLLIDHGEREIMEGDVFLKKRMGTEQKVNIAKRETIEDLLAAGPRSRPVKMATRRPAASASGAIVARCWRARISVGAMIAAWRPASITAAAAVSATTVFPEPTSPCRSRSMRCGRARSVMMSSSAFCCE